MIEAEEKLPFDCVEKVEEPVNTHYMQEGSLTYSLANFTKVN